MFHRGPDGEGVWANPDGTVEFGHRRLAVIDLTPGGHQPMTSASGRTTVTFNGEIYNYRELRSELLAAGRHFRSESDTEVLLEAWEAWGEDAPSRLRGMFAFGLWDQRTGTFHAGRDRAGEKPLYYWCAGGALLFASELQALLAFPEVPRRTSLALVDHYLAAGYPPAGEALIDGVRRLPAGHSLRFKPGWASPEVAPYWRLPDPPPPEIPLALGPLVEELERLLEDAVGEQLHADVPIGVLLSGGVDSSLVTALAARRQPGRVRTFTVTFPGAPHHDESAYASMVARHCGTQHRELPLPEPTSDLPESLGRSLGEPMGDSSVIPTYLVSKLIRQEATVALGGDGGDELFGGYVHHSLIQRYARAHRIVPEWVARRLAGLAERTLPLAAPGRGVIIQALGGPEAKLAYPRLMGPRLRRALLGPGHQPQGLQEAGVSREFSALQRSTREDFLGYMADDILVKVDRASMLNSLEVRAPFLDARVIAFAFGRVPDAAKASTTGRKLLLRALGARLLPGELDLKRKQGFSIPLGEWLRTRWRSPMLAAVQAKGFHEWISEEAMDRLVRRLDGGQPVAHQLFALWMLALWKEEHRITM